MADRLARRRRGDWRDRHPESVPAVRPDLAPAARRKSCPGCGATDLSICLTCDRARPAELFERQDPEPVTALRELVKACAGDWE